MNDLFVKEKDDVQGGYQPLADRLRPKTIEDVVGQDHLVGKAGSLTQLLDKGYVPSLIFWGPPGCGKTTLARLLAGKTDYVFEQISAIFSGVADLKKVFERAKQYKQTGKNVLLFVDEIHRFNKSQQDSFLPHIEDGTITLVGATTENPSFELNAALLSRCQVLTLKRLDGAALRKLILKAENSYGRKIPITQDALLMLINMVDGDGRYLLSMVEQIYAVEGEKDFDPDMLQKIVGKRAAVYDKGQESHYNLISALHKSVRGSDPDASLYWFARMIEGGEDPRYIARRVIRMAVEDIGLADPQALSVCVSASDTYERLGSPEGDLALAQAIVYLATAPKSNAVYMAWKSVQQQVKKTGSFMPPKHILNAPTSMMKDEGYGDGYIYDHDTPEAFSGQNYFPDEIKRTTYYHPVPRGFERDIQKRLSYWNKLRGQKQ